MERVQREEWDLVENKASPHNDTGVLHIRNIHGSGSNPLSLRPGHFVATSENQDDGLDL